MTEKELLKRLEKQLQSEYEDTQAVIRGKIAYYTKDFDKDNKEQQQRVKRGEISEKEYKQWYRKEVMTKKWCKQMEGEIAHDLATANTKAMEIINGNTSSVYLHGCIEASKDIEEEYFGFQLVDQRQAETLLKENKKLLPKGKIDPKKDIKWNERRMQSAVLQSALKGESIPKLSKRLENVVGMNRTSAIRNARTMMTASHNMGKLDVGYEAVKKGIDVRKQWIATFDSRTRDSHASMHEETVDVDERFSNGLMYPADPNGRPEEVYNCRCTMIYVRGEKSKGMSREEFDENVARIEGEKAEIRKANKALNNKEAETDKKPQKEEKKQETYADKIKALRDEANANGLTDDLINRAGETLQDEMNNAYAGIEKQVDDANNILDKCRKERHDAVIQYNDYVRQNRAFMQTPEFRVEESRLRSIYDEKHQKMLDAENNIIKIKQETHLDDMLKNKLGQIRDVGISKAGLTENDLIKATRSTVKKPLLWAFDQYPSDWIKASANYAPLNIKKVDRGYYSHWQNMIAISGKNEYNQREVAIHELGHRFEKTVSNILKQEKGFYDRRTYGESLQWMGYGYGRQEETRKDNFLDPYMGKDYKETAYELVSMGFQYAYTDPLRLKKDPDMQKWIYGLLCML